MAHYTRGDVSCIEAMESAFGKEDVATFCRVNALKYVWRMSCHEDGAVSNAEKAISSDPESASCCNFSDRSSCLTLIAQ
jgi:hypothetical protein